MDARQISTFSVQPKPRLSPRSRRPRRVGARYLRVLVDTDQNGRNTRVNVRVPMALLRAGVRLSGLAPEEARERANAAMRAKGIAFDPTS